MILLLTAGEAPRYYKDLLRVIAQPAGSHIQFRYESALVADTLWSRFAARQLGGFRCLIAYLDQRTTKTDDNIIPLRFATVIQAWTHGSTALILLQLDGFAEADSLSATRKQALTSGENSSSSRLVSEITQGLTTTKESQRPETWEVVVTRMAARELFSNEERFFSVHRVLALKRATRAPVTLAPDGGRFSLKPGREYGLELYQFHPGGRNVNYRVTFSTSNEELLVTAGAPVVADSPYNQPYIRMRTGEPDRKQETLLTIHTESDQRDTDFAFELPFEIKGRWMRTTGYVVLVGGLLAGPQIASISQVTLPHLIVILASSLAAAAVVALGFKKIR